MATLSCLASGEDAFPPIVNDQEVDLFLSDKYMECEKSNNWGWGDLLKELGRFTDTSPNKSSFYAVAYRPSGGSLVAEIYERLPIGAVANCSVEEYDARSFRRSRKITEATQNADALTFSSASGFLHIGDAGSVNHWRSELSK